VSLRRLDLNLLLVFDTVYATRSNTRAAEKLGVTQSAVSNALRRLREHLDDALFERKGGDYVPTPRADRLAPAVRQALQAIETSIDVGQGFDPVTSDRVFSLLLPDSIELQLLPPLISDVADRGYGIAFRTAPLFHVDIAETLASRRADFAIVPNPIHDAHVTSAYLFDEDVCLVCRAGHPEFGEAESFSLTDMPRVRLASLDESLRRTTHTESEMREKQVARTMTCTVTRLWSLPGLVARTDLFAVLPRSMAESLRTAFGLKLFDLPLERPAQQWHLVWHRDCEHDPGHRWMKERIKGVFATSA